MQKTGISGSLVTYETWLLTGVNSDYQVRATLLSGGPLTGTTGTWLACSTSRTWSVSDSVADVNSVDADLLIEIRDAVTLAVLASANVSLTAQRTS